VGTGTTLAGLAEGAPQYTRVHGVAVLKGAEYLQNEINNLLTQPKSFTLHHQFHFGGYGKFDKEIIEFIHWFAQNTGILLDPVYTAKMVKGIISLAEQNYFIPGDKILALHTGGLWGLTSPKALQLAQSLHLPA
jgi:1-aminocyclopropane-1-carboxylate deaminase